MKTRERPSRAQCTATPGDDDPAGKWAEHVDRFARFLDELPVADEPTLEDRGQLALDLPAGRWSA